jgi:hypothetical protein
MVNVPRSLTQLGSTEILRPPTQFKLCPHIWHSRYHHRMLWCGSLWSSQLSVSFLPYSFLCTHQPDGSLCSSSVIMTCAHYTNNRSSATLPWCVMCLSSRMSTPLTTTRTSTTKPHRTDAQTSSPHGCATTPTIPPHSSQHATRSSFRQLGSRAVDVSPPP